MERLLFRNSESCSKPLPTPGSRDYLPEEPCPFSNFSLANPLIRQRRSGCHEGLQRWITLLISDEVIQALKEVGLFYAFDLCKVRLDWELLEAAVECWDPDLNLFLNLIGISSHPLWKKCIVFLVFFI